MPPRPKVTRSADCGNSPKSAFVEALTVALLCGNWKGVEARVADEVVWSIVGKGVVEGKARLAAALARGAGQLRHIRIERAIAHGRTGAVSGTLTLANGRTRAFTDWHEFTSAAAKRVARITSYDIAT